jgi:hypothetical protein
MKALSFRQPWATLIVTGRKSIEIRGWRPKRLTLPQMILIHASKKVDEEMLDAFGMTKDLPRGAILGEALMIEIVQYDTLDKWLQEIDKHKNSPQGFRKGLYGFVLANPKQYHEPIPGKGKLGFFDVDIDTLGRRKRWT